MEFFTNSQLSNDAYHARNEVSSTQLKWFDRSPAHFYANCIDPNRERIEQSDAMKLGSAIHTLFLEPELFNKEYAVMPKIDARTKAGKESKSIFLAENIGKTIISDEQFAEANTIASALKSHPLIDKIRAVEGFREASVIYTDDQYNVDCRVRFDYMIPPCELGPNGLIIDVKSTEDAREHAFSRTIAKYDYHLSAAMYCEGFKEAYGVIPDFIWLVVEKSRPYATAAYSLTNEVYWAGMNKYLHALELYSACKNTGKWFSYHESINPIYLPKWAI